MTTRRVFTYTLTKTFSKNEKAHLTFNTCFYCLWSDNCTTGEPIPIWLILPWSGHTAIDILSIDFWYKPRGLHNKNFPIKEKTLI